jgi:peptidyl-tRNA hydrolase, PTH2 family
MNSKQVLVMKKLPSLRTGKYIAQGSHASVGALLALGAIDDKGENFIIPLSNPFVMDWITNRFKKVTLYVTTDDELKDIHQKALEAGLSSSLIQDAGLTEFKGVPTLTAVGIGPDDAEKIDKITGHLPLF